MLALSDQITLFMVFLMLCFAGLLVMFYFVLRSMDDLSKNIRVERSALAASLHDMETSVQRLQEMAAEIMRRSSAGGKKESYSLSKESKEDTPEMAEPIPFSAEKIFTPANSPADMPSPSDDLLTMHTTVSPQEEGGNGSLQFDNGSSLVLK